MKESAKKGARAGSRKWRSSAGDREGRAQVRDRSTGAARLAEEGEAGRAVSKETGLREGAVCWRRM